MTALDPTCSLPATRMFGAAAVVAVHGSGRVRVALPGQPVRPARVAALLPRTLRCGDEVLVAGDDELFVLGLLSPAAVAPATVPIDLGGGATLDLPAHPGEPLRVHRHGELLIEFDPAAGRARVHTGEQLELVADNITLAARDRLRLAGDRIDVLARLDATFAAGTVASGGRLRLDAASAGLAAPEVALAARHLTARADEVKFTASRVDACLDVVRTVVRTLTTTVDTVCEQARTVYRRAAELLESRCGRRRTIVDGTDHLRCRQALTRATDDFKVRADRIHLG